MYGRVLRRAVGASRRPARVSALSPRFCECLSAQGGGFYVAAGVAFFTDVVFSSNSAIGVGSALYFDPADDSSVLDNVTFTGHTGVVIRIIGVLQFVCPLGYYMPWSGDYEGGDFLTTEEDGSAARHRPFERGDAIVFISHKPHHVAPVESGERRCLVIELWEGEERACAHRCSVRRGSCLLSVAPARLVQDFEAGRVQWPGYSPRRPEETAPVEGQEWSSRR